MLKKMKIGTKFSIYTFIAALIFGFLLYFIVIDIVENKFIASFKVGATDVVAEEIHKMDCRLGRYIEEFKIHSSDLQLKNFIKQSNEEFENFELEDYENIEELINARDLEWISSGNKEDIGWAKEISENDTSRDFEEILNFYQCERQCKTFGEFFATNLYGVTVAQSNWTSDYYQADESWWQEAKKKDFFVGKVVYDRSADITGIDFAATIKEDGKILGILKSILNVDEIVAVLDESLLREEVRELYKAKSYTLFKLNGDLVYSVDKDDFLAGIDIEKDFNIGSGSILIEDKDKIFVSTFSKDTGGQYGLGWYLVAGFDKNEILQDLNMLKLFILITIFSLIFLLILLSSIFFHKLLKPLKDFNRLVENISNGVPNKLINIQASGEIAKLVKVYNKMVKKMNDYKDNMYSKIEKRTADLEKLNKHLMGRELKMIELKKELKKIKEENED